MCTFNARLCYCDFCWFYSWPFVPENEKVSLIETVMEGHKVLQSDADNHAHHRCFQKFIAHLVLSLNRYFSEIIFC